MVLLVILRCFNRGLSIKNKPSPELTVKLRPCTVNVERRALRVSRISNNGASWYYFSAKFAFHG